MFLLLLQERRCTSAAAGMAATARTEPPDTNHGTTPTSEGVESGAARRLREPEKKGPAIVINHLSGKAFKSFPDLNSSIPRFADEYKAGVHVSFPKSRKGSQTNRSHSSRPSRKRSVFG